MRSSIDVHNLLREREVAHEIILMAHPIASSEMMAGALGLPKEEVFSSLLYFLDEEPVILIIPAGRRVCKNKLKKALSIGKIREATQSELSDLTGYLGGAIPPVAHKHSTKVILDEALSAKGVLYTTAGDHLTILKIKPSDLLKVTQAQIADISKPKTA